MRPFGRSDAGNGRDRSVEGLRSDRCRCGRRARDGRAVPGRLAAGVHAPALALMVLLAGCGAPPPTPTPQPLEARALEPAGEWRMESRQSLFDTPFGGISALAWDASAQRLLALSDDRGDEAPSRYYQARIDLADGRLDAGDLVWEAVTVLRDASDQPFAEDSLDPEGLALAPDGQRYLASEGDAGAEPPLPPAVLRLDPGGRETGRLPLTEAYLPDGEGDRGVRDNQGFESLALAPDGRWLVTGTQGPLAQDADPEDGGECAAHLLAWTLPDQAPAGEWRYPLDLPAGRADAEDCDKAGALTELLALDSAGGLLALERLGESGNDGPAATRLYAIRLPLGGDADAAAADGEPPRLEKRLLAELEALGLEPEGLEGMTLGPNLPDGRRALLLAGDDDFAKKADTQWLMLALDLGPTP